jgi:protein-tyrosine phosphatase
MRRSTIVTNQPFRDQQFRQWTGSCRCSFIPDVDSSKLYVKQSSLGGAKAVVWRILARLALFRARRHSLATLTDVRPSRILVVCHGNIYRSAFAGDWLQARVPSGVRVRSTGLHPLRGRPSPARHVAMARQRGVDLSRHASAVIDSADLRWADVIVLMDQRNWIGLRRLGAEPTKLVWLGAFAAGNVEIEDPYQMDDAAASVLLDRLVACAQGLLQHIAASPAVRSESGLEQPAAKFD